MKKNTKKAAAAFTACALLGTMALGGTMAYLTDNETATNTFTVGDITADLVEENYPGNDSDDVKNLVPNQIVEKDPKLVNTSANNSLIGFMTLTVPVEEITYLYDDGTEGEGGKESTALFWFLASDDGASVHENVWEGEDYDGKWILLDDKNFEGEGTYTYVFGYEDVVAAGSETETLFDKIQLKNFREDEVDAETKDIVVNTYAIQASDILENGIDLTESLDETNLGKIYEIFLNQVDISELKAANTSNEKNLAGDDL